ncbi:hypothetical protein HK101_007119, partial [Irineochytrium annulatum]
LVQTSMEGTRPFKTIVAQLRATGRFDIQEQLASIGVPTLVVHGDRDEVIPVQYGEEIAEGIKGSTWVKVKGAGHIIGEYQGVPGMVAAFVGGWEEEGEVKARL